MIRETHIMNYFFILICLLFQTCNPAKLLNVRPPEANGNWIQFLFREKLETIDTVLPENVPSDENPNSLELEWTLLAGTPNTMTTNKGFAVDQNGSIYVTGDTNGGVYGPGPIGTRDLILGKYNSQKNTIWTQQVGTAGVGLQVEGVAVDPNGNAYVTGHTNGNFANPLVGAEDLFLIKFNSADGARVWTRQIGLPGVRIVGGGYSIVPKGIAVDTFGNSYIVGNSTGAFGGPETGPNGFIIKFDTDGNQRWVSQLAIRNAQSFPRGVAFDRITGNVYMVGTGTANFATDTFPGLGGNANSDLFILRYDANNGNRQFFAQLGSALRTTEGSSITVDSSGNVFAGGTSKADYGSGADGTSWLGTLVKYNSLGVLQWVRQVGPIRGAGKQTVIETIVSDTEGNVFTTGRTNGNIPDGSADSLGRNDAFLTKHDSSGQSQWLRQIGTPGATITGNGIGSDRNGNLYGSGSTDRGINGVPTQGGSDLFIVKYK